jgi:hypothetical protein
MILLVRRRGGNVVQDHGHPYQRIQAAIQWAIASSWLVMLGFLVLV